MRQTPFLLGTRISMGVSCEALASQVAVIPAKAGIHSAGLRRCDVYRLDSSRHGGTGMTGVSKWILRQMTPLPGWAKLFFLPPHDMFCDFRGAPAPMAKGWVGGPEPWRVCRKGASLEMKR